MSREEELDRVLGIVAENSPCSKTHISWSAADALSTLVGLGYVTLDTRVSDTYAISAEGMLCYLNGGFVKMKAKNRLEVEDLIWSLKINKWQHRMRWLPFIVSGLALLASIITLCIA